MKSTLTTLIFVTLLLITNAQSNTPIQLQHNQIQSVKEDSSGDDFEELAVRVHLDPVLITPVQLNENCSPFQIPFNETFDGESVECLSFPEGPGNWGFNDFYTPPSSASGAPNAYFNWSPNQINYSFSLTSPLIDATNFSEVKIDYLLLSNRFSSATLEQMSVEYKTETDETWIMLEVFNNQGPTNITEFIREEQELVGVEGNFFRFGLGHMVKTALILMDGVWMMCISMVQQMKCFWEMQIAMTLWMYWM